MGIYRPVSFLFTYILRCGAEKLKVVVGLVKTWEGCNIIAGERKGHGVVCCVCSFDFGD
jgi:hypothetical protein